MAALVFWIMVNLYHTVRFSEFEKEQINQFMKVNNELPTIICENCGKRLMPGDCFYKWGGHNFCSKSCVATYITEQADLPKYVFE